MLRKTKYDMHLSIFKRNPDLMYFIIFILSSEGNKKLIPFRNKNCRNGNCIYDLDELVKKYKDSHFSNYMNFICHHCKELIDINNFFLDMTLKKIIDDVFVKYNKIKLQCKEITIFRNGLWEPNLPEYLKLLEKNIDSNSSLIFFN